jgi:ASC-1-like (ASCH) protein
MKHELKILKQFADEIKQGNKYFEVRKNDRAYQKGDVIQFKAIEKHGDMEIEVEHPINHVLYEITYVLSGWGIEKGYVVLGIKWTI